MILIFPRIYLNTLNNMNIKKYTKILSIFTLITPSVSFAALLGLRGLLYDFRELIDLAVRVIFALALAYFFWGGAQFILNDAANEKTREDGKKKMMWGIIALFVMFSIYGILRAIGALIDIPVGGGSGLSLSLLVNFS